MKYETKSKLVISSEILFILLPLMIHYITDMAHNEFIKMFFSSELSFASIILFGQTIVKLASGIANRDKRLIWQYISLIFSLIVVFGVIPSTLTLIFILIGYTVQWLYILQLSLFIISIMVYYIFGTIGQIFIDQSEVR